MPDQETEKPVVKHIASNVAERFRNKVAKLKEQGWIVKKRWKQYDCFFADLVKSKDTQA
jgi:hypothetical protein